jgi:hypothetical protein
MIGRGWGCTGTSLAPPTTSSTHPQLCIGCSEERSLAQNTLKKESPGRVQQPQIRAFTAPCECRRASHLVLLLGLGRGVLLRRCLAGKYDLAVRPQSQCSANPNAHVCREPAIGIQAGIGSRLKHQHQHQHQELPIAELPYLSLRLLNSPTYQKLPLNAQHTPGPGHTLHILQTPIV